MLERVPVGSPAGATSTAAVSRVRLSLGIYIHPLRPLEALVGMSQSVPELGTNLGTNSTRRKFSDGQLLEKNDGQGWEFPPCHRASLVTGRVMAQVERDPELIAVVDAVANGTLDAYSGVERILARLLRQP